MLAAVPAALVVSLPLKALTLNPPTPSIDSSAVDSPPVQSFMFLVSSSASSTAPNLFDFSVARKEADRDTMLKASDQTRFT